MIRMASAGSRFRRQSTQPRVLRVGPRQHLGRVGDVGDQVGHRALRLGRRGDQRGRAGRLGEADVEAHVGAAGRRRSRRALRPSRRPARSSSAIASASARSAARNATPSSTASRTSQRSRQSASSSRRAGRRRGGASATNVPPPRPRTACRWPLCTSAVSAWRSVERAIPSCSHSSRSGGQPRAGRQQAELDRGAEPLERLLERRRGLDRREDGLRRSQPLEPPYALPVGDGGLERLELDAGVVEVVLDDLLAERARGRLAGREQVARLAQRRRHVRLVGRVGVARAAAARARARRRARAARRRSSPPAPGRG